MSKKLMYLVCVAITALFVGPAAQAAHDVTKPGDPVQGVPNDGVSPGNNAAIGWPGNEGPDQAIDDQITTKYLHFKGEVEPTGFRVSPKVGPTVVTGLRLSTANDAVERDPVAWELSGSNESINGPYTPIAKGPLTDFVGGLWPRRTWNATPITFANTVSYKHYQLMLTPVSNPGAANSMQIAEVELLEADLKANKPNPAPGAIVTMPLFQWTKGDTAQAHNVYLGTSPDLTAADLRSAKLPGAMGMYYHVAPPLEPGVTYYWRVDEIDAAGTVITGDVWSVMIAPKTAFSPMPRDGDKWIAVNAPLSWQPGQGGIKHDVYFGIDKAAVEARSAGVAKGTLTTLTFDPGALAQNTTYYWVVDETTVSGQKVAGPVWSFTTVGGGGGLRGEYFAGNAPSGEPALSRIDQSVDLNLTGATSPGAPIPGDGWSARWTADLEIAVADTFRFSVNCQDGTRLWIDGELIIDKWVTPTVTSEYFSVPIYLEKGIHSLVLEFYDSGGDAVEQLYWSTATMAKVIVPAGPLQPPYHAAAYYPGGKAVDVPQELTLSWKAGEKAAQHDVYFGDNAQAVADATPATADVYKGRQKLAENTFAPGTLEWNKTYYWRIDEVNDTATGSPWKGNVWSFTTANFIVVDNMETYTDDTGNEIFTVWVDGFTDQKSNSTVGNMQAPFAEVVYVNSGRQALNLAYDNTRAPFFSEAQREFAPAQDWTVSGMNTLQLALQGMATNGAGQVYVSVEDSAGKSATVVNANAAAVTSGIYSEWKVALSQFAGVDLAKVKKLYLGVGDKKAPSAGGAGTIYVDDIRVIKQ